MDTITLISVIPTMAIIASGFVMLARDRGYAFDLRQPSRPLPFGRRATDRRVRVQTSPG